MGKRTRRNTKRKGNKSSSNSNTSPYQDPSGGGTYNDSSSVAPPSVLLQRIRHADPRTRHAALAAVANTLLDTSTTTTRTHYPKVSPTLLQAIRERIMDSDLDVCQVAAGCLANYVTICSSISSADANQVSQQQAMTAGWILVLVGRLKQSYQQVAQIMNSQKTADTNTTQNNPSSNKQPHPKNNHTIKQQKQWLALAVQCLRTLCILMETNPQAVQRLTSSLDATPRHDFHQALLEWMLQGQQYLQQQQPDNTAATSAAAAAAKTSAMEQHDAAMRSYYEQIFTLSARTLHSAWDDNADLLGPWKEECPDAFRRGLELVQSIMTPSIPPQPELPVVAQLHATGAFLAARPLVLAELSSNDNLQGAPVTQQQVVISQLTQRMTAFSWTTVQSLLEKYQEACQKWEQEQADDALERDVIRKVQDRKEPAREIARRQKAQRDAQEGMEDDEEEKERNIKQQEQQDTMDEGNRATQQEVETQEALEQAREEWNKFLLPLQLSLELLANLTSSNTNPVDDGDDDDDDDMMMVEDWGPDQEARWMQEQQMHPAGKQHPTKASNDEALQKVLVESPLPQHLMHLFRQVYQVPPPTVNFPEQSRHDLQDLQSKTVACMGNCWENIASWPMHDLSWTELQQAATTATGLGKEALISALVIALKTYPSLRNEWKPEHLAVWLQELQPPSKQQQDGSNMGNASNSLSIRRDVISMLGVLCSQEPHPVSVNQQVCTALLSALTTCSDDDNSIAIQCEVLNVLMDMYGNDEEDGCCHPSVFESLQVLGHFQRCIPHLKSKLKLHEKKLKNGGADDNRVELEQWKETVLNANRFIQYKKGQL